MNEELKLIKKEFGKIKALDYIYIVNANDNNILKKFRELLMKNKTIKTNNLWRLNIKLNNNTNKYFTLFDIKPDSSYDIDFLKEKYGECDLVYKKAKVINSVVQANCSSLVGTRFLFKLEVDYEEERIYLAIYNQSFNLLNRSVYWDFKTIKNKLNRKYSHIIYVKTWFKMVNRRSYYKFYDILFYQLKSFPEFIKLLEMGIIRLNIKMDVCTKGDFIGHSYCVGTYFEIQEVDILKMFDSILV